MEIVRGVIRALRKKTPLRSEASIASVALAHHGRGSRGPLKGPWWGPGEMPRWGSRGWSPPKLQGFYT